MLAVGEIVDRFVVQGHIGRGGMAEVYEVRHRVLETRHALKVLRRRGARDRQGLVDEGRIQARLDPTHIVPVTDVIDVHACPALLMPLIRGCSLAELLAEHALTASQVVALFRCVLRGVRAAHEAGVVHRDLKPANILLDLRAQRVVPRVADFGIATSSANELDARVAGTPRFAAPEQLDGHGPIDHRADLYSLGVVLGDMLGSLDHSALREVERALRVVDRSERPRSCSQVAQWLAREQADDLDADGEIYRRVDAIRAARSASLAGGVPSGYAASTLLSFEPGAADVRGAPVHADAFVGRRGELTRLRELCASGERLVTVLGPGGGGKTRLVVEYATTEATGDLWFCSVVQARDLLGVVACVAEALGIAPRGQDLSERVGRVLARVGPATLILDNVEQVVPHAEACISAWCEAAPELVVVVTSQTRLCTPGAVLELAGLPVLDAVQLFMDRAHKVHTIGGVEGPVERLVELLDRSPLAIELAAARVGVLSVQQMLERIGRRFRLLSSRGDHRHAALRSTLDWSWSLLDDTERSALAQFAVFEGVFGVEAAEGVVDVGDAWVVDVLEALLHKSLVRRTDDDRFVLLLSVRDYAWERCTQAGQALPVADRHAAWIAEFGQRYLPYSGPPAHEAQMRLLVADARAGCRHASGRQQGRVAVGCLRAVWAATRSSGPYASVLGLADQCARADGVDAVIALGIEATCQRYLGHMERSAELSQQALDLLGSQEPGLQAWLCGALMARAFRSGDLPSAMRLADLAQSRADASGDPLRSSFALNLRGLVYWQMGQLDRARACYERALGLAKEAPWECGSIYGNLALIDELAGRFDDARLHGERAIEIAQQRGDLRSEGIALSNLAVVLAAESRYDEALHVTARALRLHERVGDVRSEMYPLTNMGWLHLYMGDYDAARGHLLRALPLARRFVNAQLPRLLCALAVLDAIQQHPGWEDYIDQAVAACDGQVRVEVLTHRAILRLHADRTADAQRDLLLASEPTSTGRDAARLHAAWAYLRYRQGRLREAGHLLEQAEQAAGQSHGPGSLLGREIRAVRQRIATAK